MVGCSCNDCEGPETQKDKTAVFVIVMSILLVMVHAGLPYYLKLAYRVRVI